MQMQFNTSKNVRNGYNLKMGNQLNANNIFNVNVVKPRQQQLAQTFTQIEKPVVNIPVPTNESKKMKWGEPIWYFFHTIAEKVKEDMFPIIRVELLANIYSICANLPCPKCTKHAMEYMSKVNFDSISTKEDLKIFLFNFHNEVNKRKDLPIFQLIELNAKYPTAKTLSIFQNFFTEYSKIDFNINLLSENTNRRILIPKLKRWFNMNINSFNF